MTHPQREILKTLAALAVMIAGFVFLGYVLTCVPACNAPQGRQGTVEATATTLTRADVRAEVEAVVAPRVEAVVAAVADTSERITETTQQAVVATNKTDNSTSDRVVNRLLAAGAVVTLVSYSAGKLIWLAIGLPWRRRKRPRARARPP